MDDATGQVVLVDPAEPRSIEIALQETVGKSEVNAILITHRHWDHAGKAHSYAYTRPLTDLK